MFPTIQHNAANNANHCISPSHEPHGPNKRSRPTTVQPVQSALSCISCPDALIAFLEFKEVYALSQVNREFRDKLIRDKRQYSYLKNPSSRLIAFYVQEQLCFRHATPWSSGQYSKNIAQERNLLIHKIRIMENSLINSKVEIIPFSHIQSLVWTPSQCERYHSPQDYPQCKWTSSLLRQCQDDRSYHPDTVNRFKLENFKSLQTLIFSNYNSNNTKIINSIFLIRIQTHITGLNLQTLTFLDCFMGRVHFQDLKDLKKLNKLSFIHCEEVTIPNLVHLTALKKLEIDGCDWEHGELEKNTQLHMLEIRNSNNLDDDLCDLNKLSEMRHLNISGYEKVNDIAQLSKFTGLQKLENLITSLTVSRLELRQLRQYFPALHHFSDRDGPWVTNDQFTMYWPPRETSEDTLNGKKRKRD